MNNQFRVELLHEPTDDPDHENIDVVVEFESQRFAATFFTLRNINRIMERHQASGESDHGRYFWASDMIVVPRITLEEIERTVSHLIEVGEFETAFRKLGAHVAAPS